MRVDIGTRDFDRTRRMIDWLKDSQNRILVVHSEQEAYRLRDFYDPDGIMELANRIVSADAWLGAGPSFNLPTLAIADADLILEQLFGKVELVSMSGDTDG